MNLIVQFIHRTLPLKSDALVHFAPAPASAFHCLAARLPGTACQLVNQVHRNRLLQI